MCLFARKSWLSWGRRHARMVTRIKLQAAVAPLGTRMFLAVGGGFTAAGMNAEYFNNTSLTTPASFTRKDVRVDFDWGSTVKPGGSTAPGFRDIGTTNYSVRWTGQVIPRFSETYTFRTTSDDGVRLYIKPTSSQTWTTLINNWTAHTVTDNTATYALTAATTYDIKMEYWQNTGAAVARLRWSSPSTPEEVIDPVTQSGINNPDWAAGFTDIVKGGMRNFWDGYNDGVTSYPAPTMDSNGWPQGVSFQYIFQEGLMKALAVDPLMRGKIAFSFNGKADLSIGGNVVPGSLVHSYSRGTNLTTGTFSTREPTLEADKRNASYINFERTTRTGVTGGPVGITNLKMMRPTAPGATTTYAADTTFTPQLRDAMGHYTVIRYQLVSNQEKDWSDRTTPAFFNQAAGSKTGPHYGVGPDVNNGASWEYKIMLANETGRDMMISLPTVASNDYITKLANLIKYGSDGVNPYTSSQANPVYPGLNPNLRVYFELENELWNLPYWIDSQNLNQITAADADANNADFQAINYDHLPTNKPDGINYDWVTSMQYWRYRKALLRTMQASDIFRSVFGDSAMPNAGNVDARIRPLYEWQYANIGDTASIALTWAEKYFNNGDGVSHVTTPHPINYWLWGGGGASYYGAINGSGLTDLPSDNSFDAVSVANGYHQNPVGTIFTFTGTAGIARDSGPSDDIPTPLSGSQVGYITDTASISFNFTVPTSQTSNFYGFSFKAVNRTPTGSSTANTENLRVYLDNTIDITAKITMSQSHGDGYIPTGFDPANPWKAYNSVGNPSDYYFSKAFSLTAGSTHKITIKGMGDKWHTPAHTNQTVLIDDVRITSVDRIFTDGMPGGGEAFGQPAGQNIQNTLNTEVNWAKAFGLQELGYESGWSLGGDDGGSDLQNQAKYGDSRAVAAQEAFMNYVAQAGAAVNVYGTYAQWPVWSESFGQQGLLNVSQYPIVQGVDDRANHLPVEVTNGVQATAVLKPSTAAMTTIDASSTTGQITAAGGWINWMVIVPRTGTYNLSLFTSGSGAAAVVLADNQQVASGATGGTLTGTVTLTKGNHSLRVRSNSGTSFTVTQLSISGQGAPASPTLNPPADGGGAPNLTWNPVSGATGYVVRYGTASGVYTNRVDVGTATSYALSSVPGYQQYLFAVDAYNANGESLPSNEMSIAVPAAPSGLSATGISSTQINLAWTDNSSNESGFKIDRATTSDFTEGLTTFTVNPGTTSYSDTTVTATVTYYYRIRAHNGVGNSASSSTASAVAQYTTQSTINISQGTYLKSNDIPFAPQEFLSVGYFTGYNLNGGYSFQLPTLPVGQQIVSIVFQAGSTASYWSAPSDVPKLKQLSGDVYGLRISASASLLQTDYGSGTNQPGTKLTTNWFTGTLGATPDVDITGWVTATGYAAGQYVQLRTGTTATETEINNVQAFWWTLASNARLKVTTTSQTVPNAPSGLRATPVTSSQINLTWTDNSSNETNFRIERATNSGFTAGLTAFTVGANTTSYSDTSASSGTTYYYRVYAYNAPGNSANSSTVNTITVGLYQGSMIRTPWGPFIHRIICASVLSPAAVCSSFTTCRRPAARR